MKKILSVLLTIFMLVNLLVVAAVPTMADAAVNLPANTAIVNLSAQESDTTVVWQGTTYNVTYGENYFNTLNGARDTLTAGGTMMLMPGSYGAFAPGKSMTILGPQAGVNPNVKGANATDAWTLNSARSKTDATKEAIFTAAVYTTTGGDVAIAGTTNIVIDGVVFSNNGGYIRSLSYDESVQIVTIKNSIVQDRSVPFIYTYQGAQSAAYTTNKAQRYVNLENIYVTGRTTKSLLGYLPAAGLNVDGLYMDSTCTCSVIDALYVPNTTLETPISYSFKNSMIATQYTGNAIMELSFVYDGGATEPYKTLANFNASNTRPVNITVDSCVFKGLANDLATVRFRAATANETVTITNNIFDQTGKSVGKAIMNWGTKLIATKWVIDNNTFIDGNYAANLNANYQDGYVWMTRSLYIKNGAVVEPVRYGMSGNGNYYTDAEKTTLCYDSDGNPEYKLLGVQATAVDTENDTVDLRFVFPVGTETELTNAGLYVMIDEDTTAGNIIKTGKVAATEVYKSINAGFGATKVTSEVGYLMAVIIEDVPVDMANMVMTVQPYYTKADGTVVETQKYNFAVTAEGEIVDKADYTVSAKWIIDVPKADATYVNTTVVDGNVVFNYTATEQQVAAYKAVLVAAGFAAGEENVYAKDNTVVTLAVADGALTVTVSPLAS